jgi:7-cyano-7-deazaguanine reductase
MLKKIKLDNFAKVGFIKLTFSELSAICPVSHEPDYYSLNIEFSPNDYSLEVGTLKLYLLTFRDKEIFAENLVNEICCKLYNILKPVYLSAKLIRNSPENGIGIEVFQQLGWEEKL